MNNGESNFYSLIFNMQNGLVSFLNETNPKLYDLEVIFFKILLAASRE